MLCLSRYEWSTLIPFLLVASCLLVWAKIDVSSLYTHFMKDSLNKHCLYHHSYYFQGNLPKAATEKDPSAGVRVSRRSIAHPVHQHGSLFFQHPQRHVRWNQADI